MSDLGSFSYLDWPSPYVLRMGGDWRNIHEKLFYRHPPVKRVGYT